MAAMSSKAPLNQFAVEASRARNLEATTSNQSIKERLSSFGAPTRFSNRVTRSFKASIPDTIYEQPCSDTYCHMANF
ncbi:hypothetical protein CsSME_00025790 [Camellia sinensis var. sinensis]